MSSDWRMFPLQIVTNPGLDASKVSLIRNKVPNPSGKSRLRKRCTDALTMCLRSYSGSVFLPRPLPHPSLLNMDCLSLKANQVHEFLFPFSETGFIPFSNVTRALLYPITQL